MKTYSILAALLSAVILSACGGSGGGDGDDEPKPPPSSMVPGGTPSSPAVMSLEQRNEISSNPFHNYFNYKAKKGEVIHIGVTLNTPMDAIWNSRCSFSGPGSPYKAIAVNGVSKTCGESLNYTFPSDGTYTFSFGYPDSNSGYFEADVNSSTKASSSQSSNTQASDYNGTYDLEIVPAGNAPGGCSEGSGSLRLKDSSVTGGANDNNTGETITFSGSIENDGFVKGQLKFSFGGTGSYNGLVTNSGSGDGTWKDQNGCFGDWTVEKQ